MIPLRPEPLPAVARPLASVVAQAAERAAVAPPWVVVEDGAGEWFRLAAEAPPAERARLVAVLATDRALVQATELGIGGALWLPPSTLTAVDAFAAAAARPQPAGALEPGVLAARLGEGEAVLAVTVARRRFWRVQIGDAAIMTLLGELARILGVLPVMLPWPALLLTAESRDSVDRAWAELADDPPQILVAEVGDAWRHHGLAATAAAALAEVESAPSEPCSSPLQAVCELPNGCMVGRWGPLGRAASGEGVWEARPTVAAGAGFAWRLAERGAEDLAAVDVVSPEQVAAAAPAVPRMVGWAARHLRAGSPAGLLVDRLAAAAERVGAPLWVSNVDGPALYHLLRLPGRLWVDGPAVPEPGQPR